MRGEAAKCDRNRDGHLDVKFEEVRIRQLNVAARTQTAVDGIKNS